MKAIITPIDEFFKASELSDTALTNYFSKMPKYRGRFYVQMKALVARELRKKGYTLERISRILFSNSDRHDTVIYYLRSYRDIAEVDEIKSNYKQWIREGIYPKTEQINTMIKDPDCLPNEIAYLRVSRTDLKLERL
jgi:predicted transcriptional regulator